MQRFRLILIVLSVLTHSVLLNAAQERKTQEYIDQYKNKDLKKKYLTPELLDRISKLQTQDELKNQYMKDLTKQYLPEQNVTEDIEKNVITGERLVLFISSSIPTHVLRNYARQIEKHKGIMVLRGGIGGIKKIMPTIQYMNDILKKDPGCSGEKCAYFNTDVIIDPKLFQFNDITRVPALIYLPEMKIQSYCTPNERNENISKDVVYGDATLEYMIEALYKVTKTAGLRKYLKESSSD